MPEFMLKRRESGRFPVSRFMKKHRKNTVGDAFIPNHLLHHVSRIYDFYFGSDAPVNINLDQDLIYQIKTDYFSKNVPVDWLDCAVFQILELLYSSFQGFVENLNKLEQSNTRKIEHSKRASSVYSVLFGGDSREKRSSIYSCYFASQVSDSSEYSSADILDDYIPEKPEISSDLVTTISPDWESEKDMRDIMEVELINSNPTKNVLSKLTRQLYLDSSGLCLLTATNQ